MLSDVHMPDMDGFKLLEIIQFELALPVLMMSANSDSSVVLRGIIHGAVDYLLKPVRIEELRNIWQHDNPNYELKDIKPASRPAACSTFASPKYAM